MCAQIKSHAIYHLHYVFLKDVSLALHLCNSQFYTVHIFSFFTILYPEGYLRDFHLSSHIKIQETQRFLQLERADIVEFA